MNIESVVEIDKPPSEVYDFLMDDENLTLWLKNFVRREQLSGDNREVGSTSRYVYNENGRIVEYLEEVVANEKDKLFEDVLYNDYLEFRFRNEIQTFEQCNTCLKVLAEIKPKNLFSRLMLMFSRKKIIKRHKENLARLKDAVEKLADIE